VESLDIQAAVTFTGRLEHWQTVLEAADIFCLPRAGATFREEPIHALAAGLAVVAADDSLYDGFIDGTTALLFPPGDEVGIADRICRLLDNPELSARLAAAAQAHARANYSVARMVADHVRLYRQLETRSRTLTLAGSRSPANA
jgi:glycosyltransferase involved in cell wall biosynthesis